MAARAIWKGQVRFGSVELPVKLYSAVADRGIHFRLLDARHKEPVHQRMVDPSTGKVVDPGQIGRAFQAESGELVLLDEEELAVLEPKASRDIEVVRFVPSGEITHQWYDRPYYLGPDGAAAEYFALARALGDRWEGVTRWVMRGKSYRGALRADGDHLMLMTLRDAAEVIPASALSPPAGRAIDRREVVMAEQLIGAMEGNLDLASFRDEYRDRVLELVEAKASGKVVRLPKARTKPSDAPLADVLAKSLAAAKERRASA